MITHTLKNLVLHEEAKNFCSQWLDGSVKEMSRNLSDASEFSEIKIFWLMAYEFQNSRRKYVMKKLFTRLMKLKKDREWREISQWLN